MLLSFLRRANTYIPPQLKPNRIPFQRPTRIPSPSRRYINMAAPLEEKPAISEPLLEEKTGAHVTQEKEEGVLTKSGGEKVSI